VVTGRGRWAARGAFLPIGMLLAFAVPVEGGAQRVPGHWIVEASGAALNTGVEGESTRVGGQFGVGREWRRPIGGPPAPGEVPPPTVLLAVVAGVPAGAWTRGDVPVSLIARAGAVWRVAAGPLNRLGGAAFGGVNPGAGGAALRLERDPVAAVQLGWVRLVGQGGEETAAVGPSERRARAGPFVSVELRGGFVRDQLRGLGW
jgi:hypothetical protein